MNKIKLFTLLLVFTLPLVSTAQDAPVEVIVIENDAPDVITPTKGILETSDKNYVYLNTYLIGRGAFVIGYERMLTTMHGVNFEFGLTHRDFVYELMQDKSNAGATVTAGKYMSFNYKLYPALNLHYDENIYISPGFIHRSYNIAETVSYSGPDGYAEELVPVGYSMTDLSLKAGYVYESWWLNSGFVMDFYLGFGLRTTKENTYEVVNENNYSKVEKSIDEVKSQAAVYLGGKIGFIF